MKTYLIRRCGEKDLIITADGIDRVGAGDIRPVVVLFTGDRTSAVIHLGFGETIEEVTPDTQE